MTSGGTVIKTPMRVAALVMTVGLGLAACGSSTPTANNAGLVTTTPAGTTQVASVVWGLPNGEPSSIDPIYAGDESSMTVVANMCENLMALQPDFSLQGGLATSATYTNNTTFVIDLRSGIKFWDGTPMTAADVVYSLKRTANPATGSYYSGAFTEVASITQSGPLQVTLKMKQPDAQLRDALAGPTGNVVEAAYAAKAGKAFGTPSGGLMCTGPYQFVSWKSGDSITMKANQNYWNGKPLVQQISFRFISDTSTLTTALKSGEIDGAYDLPFASVVALQNGDSGTVYHGPSTASLSFGPTSSTGYGADPRVRQALNLAIDKQGLIDSVLRGQGSIQKTFTAPLAWSGDPAHAAYQTGYDALPANDTVDLTQAKQLVQDAGASGKTLVMAIPAGGSTETQAATIVQAAGKTIGLNIQLKAMQPTQFGQLFYDPTKRVGIDFVCTVGYQEAPGALYYAPEFALPGGLYNWSNYSNPQVTKLLNAARTTLDPNVTAQNFVAAQAIFAPAQLQVTLAGIDSLLYLRKGLTGAVASVAYYSSPWALHLGGTS
jgi:peptide/nickel transport system substrate-binding protein